MRPRVTYALREGLHQSSTKKNENISRPTPITCILAIYLKSKRQKTLVSRTVLNRESTYHKSGAVKLKSRFKHQQGNASDK